MRSGTALRKRQWLPQLTTYCSLWPTSEHSLLLIYCIFHKLIPIKINSKKEQNLGIANIYKRKKKDTCILNSYKHMNWFCSNFILEAVDWKRILKVQCRPLSSSFFSHLVGQAQPKQQHCCFSLFPSLSLPGFLKEEAEMPFWVAVSLQDVVNRES